MYTFTFTKNVECINIMHLSEVVFYDEFNNIIEVISAVGIDGNHKSNETPDKLIDNNVKTKWIEMDFNCEKEGKQILFTINSNQNAVTMLRQKR